METKTLTLRDSAKAVRANYESAEIVVISTHPLQWKKKVDGVFIDMLPAQPTTVMVTTEKDAEGKLLTYAAPDSAMHNIPSTFGKGVKATVYYTIEPFGESQEDRIFVRDVQFEGSNRQILTDEQAKLIFG